MGRRWSRTGVRWDALKGYELISVEMGCEMVNALRWFRLGKFVNAFESQVLISSSLSIFLHVPNAEKAGHGVRHPANLGPLLS